jgi:transposase
MTCFLYCLWTSLHFCFVGGGDWTAWRSVDVEEQRVRFVVRASEGEARLGELCAEFGVSRPTGRLWLKRYQASGIAGLGDRSRPPLESPRRTSQAIEDRIVALRAGRPDWGARKLSVLLAREGLTVPAATVHRVLNRRGLVRVEDRHRPALGRFEREHPNQLWQMDFKSPKGWGGQPVGPLSVLDDHSRYAIALFQAGTTQGDAVARSNGEVGGDRDGSGRAVGFAGSADAEAITDWASENRNGCRSSFHGKKRGSFPRA